MNSKKMFRKFSINISVVKIKIDFQHLEIQQIVYFYLFKIQNMITVRNNLKPFMI